MVVAQREAFARRIEAIISRADSHPPLAEIKIPTLVIVGADDQLMAPENGREIAAGIAGARLEALAHCRHMSSVEKPESVTKLLDAFLA